VDLSEELAIFLNNEKIRKTRSEAPNTIPTQGMRSLMPPEANTKPS
jgi:hypothetical protein